METPRQNPVLMIFEDAHWADPTSLEAFGRVDRIRTLRVLLLVMFWTALRHLPHHQSADRARSRGHDRPHSRQQAAASKYPPGHHRAYRRYSLICGGDDQGGAGGGERGCGRARSRRSTILGPGGPRKPACLANGANSTDSALQPICLFAWHSEPLVDHHSYSEIAVNAQRLLRKTSILNTDKEIRLSLSVSPDTLMKNLVPDLRPSYLDRRGLAVSISHATAKR